MPRQPTGLPKEAKTYDGVVRGAKARSENVTTAPANDCPYRDCRGNLSEEELPRRDGKKRILYGCLICGWEGERAAFKAAYNTLRPRR